MIDSSTLRLVRSLALERGDEPGRVVIDGAARAHVVLRGAGAIADIDLATGALRGRRVVCAVPRGIAFRESDDSLHVACAEGLLVTLPAAGGTPTRRVRVADDLRDVVVHGDVLYVTQFRSARVIRLDANGAIAAQNVPAELDAIPELVSVPMTELGDFQPAVAWRAIPTPDGVMVLHQRALSAEFVAAGGYGRGRGCAGALVHDAVFEVRGRAEPSIVGGAPLEGAILGVDVALSPDGARIAVASPASSSLLVGEIRDDVFVYTRAAASAPADDGEHCAPPDQRAIGLEGNAIAVAFLPDGRLVAQTRDPAIVFVEPSIDGASAARIELSDRTTYDPGHELFHMATVAGLACASCHPEGGDDGRVWRLDDIGPRRTQTLRGGLLETAPFHWDGDMEEISVLLERVYVGRMSGRYLHEDAVPRFAAWMDSLPALRRPAASDADSVARGRALFHDAVVGCASCHAGPELTNDATVDVGTGGALQVPTLVGIAYRAPYLHDGCAPTLRDRFGPCGGGDAHGRTSQLRSAQIDDLVAYLETL